MSSIDYEKRIKQVPKKYAFLYGLFKPAVYDIQLSNNKMSAVAYYSDGSVMRHQLTGDFSSPRLLIADFEKTLELLTILLKKFPRSTLMIGSYANIDVIDEWEGGLTPLELKAIYEMVLSASSKASRNIIACQISHQGTAVFCSVNR